MPPPIKKKGREKRPRKMPEDLLANAYKDAMSYVTKATQPNSLGKRSWKKMATVAIISFLKNNPQRAPTLPTLKGLIAAIFFNDNLELSPPITGIKAFNNPNELCPWNDRNAPFWMGGDRKSCEKFNKALKEVAEKVGQTYHLKN